MSDWQTLQSGTVSHMFKKHLYFISCCKLLPATQLLSCKHIPAIGKTQAFYYLKYSERVFNEIPPCLSHLSMSVSLFHNFWVMLPRAAIAPGSCSCCYCWVCCLCSTPISCSRNICCSDSSWSLTNTLCILILYMCQEREHLPASEETQKLIVVGSLSMTCERVKQISWV